MLARFKACDAAGRQSWPSGWARRGSRLAPTPVRDDSLPGPGPSSLAAAAGAAAAAAAAATTRPTRAGPASAAAAAAAVAAAVPLAGPLGPGRHGRCLLTVNTPSSGRDRLPPPSAAAQQPITISTTSTASTTAAASTATAASAAGKRRNYNRRRSKAKARAEAAVRAKGEQQEQEQDKGGDGVLDTTGSAPAGAAVIGTRASGGVGGGGGSPPDSLEESAPSIRKVKSIFDIAAAASGGGAGGGGSGGGSAAAARQRRAGDGSSCGGGSAAAGAAASDFPNRLADGRQVVYVKEDTAATAAAAALSHALGVERRGVVRFNGGGAGLRGMRVLTLGNIFMGSFQRALSFVVDVRHAPHDRSTPFDAERPASGEVSYAYRVMARSRPLESHDERLSAAIRAARFMLDLSINVRQAWGEKGDVDEEQAYDLADTLYGALLAQQTEQDAADAEAEALRQQPQQQQQQKTGDLDLGRSGSGDLDLKLDPGQRRQRRPASSSSTSPPPPWIVVTADLAQGLTMLTALGLLQKRLREEKQEAVVETTLYRASVAAPRLDGKDGWVFVIRLAFEAPYLPVYGSRGAPAHNVKRRRGAAAGAAASVAAASAAASSLLSPGAAPAVAVVSR